MKDEEIKVDYVLDCKGKLCPWPQAKIVKKMKEMQPGETLEVLATDESSPKETEILLNRRGEEYLSSTQDKDGVYHIFVRKS